jgi:hypothetical protein
MRIYCVIEDRAKRSELFAWLSKHTSILFAGGSPVSPVGELAGIRRPVIVAADDSGLSVVLFSTRPAQYGQRVTVSVFAGAVREKFPPREDPGASSSENKSASAQLSIGGSSW